MIKRNIFMLILILVFFAGCKKDAPNIPIVNTGILVKNFNFNNEPFIGSDFVFYASTGIGYDEYIIQNIDSVIVGTNVSKLKSQFTTLNDKVQVKVNGKLQVSGVTENDFTNPVIYSANLENGEVQTIKVIVNVAKKAVTTDKYIFINQTSYSESEVQDIAAKFGGQLKKRVAVGLGVIISVLNASSANVLSKLNSQLALSLKYNLPISIKLDAEIWWDYRPDLWNWWDQSKSGFNVANKDNVEWTDWTNDSAVKLGWLNWGSQIRMVPSPNLMSQKYKEAWKAAITPCVNAIKTWYDGLPSDKKFLFGNIVVGWESSIGVSNHFYPNGNSYLNQPVTNDPTTGFNIAILPSRGLQTLGYAAVKTAGIASSGTLTEAMQTEVVRRHLEDLSKTVNDLGIPRENIFTHCGGWVKGETVYTAAINKYSCPGWSYYNYASDPTSDLTAMDALSKSDAPYWGAVEWLLQGSKTQYEWVTALTNALAKKSRVVVIYNWNSINTNLNALNAIKEINK